MAAAENAGALKKTCRRHCPERHTAFACGQPSAASQAEQAGGDQERARRPRRKSVTVGQKTGCKLSWQCSKTCEQACENFATRRHSGKYFLRSSRRQLATAPWTIKGRLPYRKRHSRRRANLPGDARRIDACGHSEFSPRSITRAVIPCRVF